MGVLGEFLPGQVFALNQQQFQQGLPSGLSNQQGIFMGSPIGSTSPFHLGMVREARKKFKEYTKAEFRNISHEPMVKEILSGLTRLNRDQILDRIKEHIKS